MCVCENVFEVYFYFSFAKQVENISLRWIKFCFLYITKTVTKKKKNEINISFVYRARRETVQ